MKRGRTYFTLDSKERWVLNDDLLYRSLLKEPGFDHLKAQIAPSLPPLPSGGQAVLELRTSRDGRMIPIIHAAGYDRLFFGEYTIHFVDADEKMTWAQVPVICGEAPSGSREIEHFEAHVWHLLNRRHRSPEDYSGVGPSTAGRKQMARSRDLPRSIARILRWLVEAEFEAAQRWTRWETPEIALEHVYLPVGLVLTLGMVDSWLKKGRLPPFDRCHEAIKAQLEDSFSYVLRKAKDSPIDAEHWKSLFDRTFQAARDGWKQRGPGFMPSVTEALAGKNVPEALLTSPEKFCREATIDPCLDSIFPPGLV